MKWEKLTLSGKKNPAKRVLFLSFVAVYLISTLIISTVAFLYLYHSFQQENVSRYRQTIDTAMELLYTEIDGCEKMASNLQNISLVRNIMSRLERYNRFELLQLKDDILRLKSTNDNFNYLGIVFHTKQMVVSSEQAYKFDEPAFLSVSIDGLSMTDWIQAEGLRNNESSLDLVYFKTFAGESQDLLFTKSIALNANEDNYRATIMILLDGKKIMGQMDIMKNNPALQLFFVDNDGTVLFSTAGQTLQNSLQFDKAILQDNNIRTIGKNLYINKKMTILGNHLNCLAVAPKTIMETQSDSIRIFVALLLVIGFSVFLGIWIAKRFSSINYTPLSNLMTSVTSLLPKRNYNTTDGNEYDYLHNALLSITIENEAAIKKLASSKEQGIQYLIYKLLNDSTLSVEETEQAVNLFRHETFRYVLADEYVPNSESYFNSRYQQFESILAQSSIDFYGTKNNSKVGYLLNYAQEPECEGLLEQLELNSTAFSGMFFCISNPVHHIENIGDVFKQAEFIAKYRLINQVTCFSQYHLVEKNSYYYLPEIETKQLLAAVIAGNEALAISIFYELYHKNLSISNMTIQGVRKFLSSICLKLERCEGDSLTSIKSSLLEHEYTSELLTTITTMIHELCATAQQKNSSRNADKLQRIWDFIDENISSNEMSLAYLSDKFNLSVSYLSQIFKENKKENFVEYVNTRRIEIAKKLLLETNHEINAIATSCGFMNDTTFRRIFKKYEGISPSAYRDAQLQSSESHR